MRGFGYTIASTDSDSMEWGMRRRGKWARRIGRAAGTVTIGVLLGFLVPTMLQDMSPKPSVQASVPEAPLARQFINAFVADDTTTLNALRIRSDIQLRAARLRSDYARVDPPIHLGSYVAGGFTLHAYAVHVVRPGGQQDTLSWRVVTAAGQVALILPPPPIEPE
jgi:hypothetical protein